MALYRCSSPSGGGGGGNYKVDTFSFNGNTEVTVNCGFEPKVIIFYTSNGLVAAIYDSQFYGATKPDQYLKVVNANASWTNVGAAGYYILKSITSTGFTVIGYSGVTVDAKFIAIG